MKVSQVENVLALFELFAREKAPRTLTAVAQQLGREPRGVLEIAYRCPNGEPAVVRDEKTPVRSGTRSV